MEIKLTFQITLVDGSETDQEISIAADPQLPIEKQQLLLLQQMLNQYAQVGLLKENPKSTFLLLCPSQLAMIRCELPSILLANGNEIPKITLE